MKLQLPEVTLVCVTVNDYHAREAAFALQHCYSLCDFGAILPLINIFDGGKRKPSDIETYCYWICNQLPNLVKTKFMLIIQWDGFVLNPGAWTDDFLGYDYIGAVWDEGDKESGANGGFSLRSTKLMQMVAELNLPKGKCLPEDVVISQTYRKYFQDNGIKFAPPDICKRFSVETNGRPPEKKYDNQFGFHNIYTPGVQDKLKAIGYNFK